MCIIPLTPSLPQHPGHPGLHPYQLLSPVYVEFLDCPTAGVRQVFFSCLFLYYICLPVLLMYIVHVSLFFFFFVIPFCTEEVIDQVPLDKPMLSFHIHLEVVFRDVEML